MQISTGKTSVDYGFFIVSVGAVTPAVCFSSMLKLST